MSELAKILVVDDEVENLRALERTLKANFQVVPCDTPQAALSKIESENFDVVMSDQRMPGMVGTELLARIAAKKPLITRIILTAYTETKEMLDAINRAEIYRYITKPWDNNELVIILRQAVEHHRLLERNKTLIDQLLKKEQELTQLNRNLEKLVEQRTAELRAVNEKLNEQAMTDPLTKLHNRRSMLLRFGEELERSKRYRHSFSVAMIDVDHFKPFNDMEGHVCGDEALRKISQILSGNLRKIDVLSRYGGEEFFLIMPETASGPASEICNRLRAAVEANTFQGQGGSAYLTISIGVAGYPQHGTSADALIKAADHALYQAKEYGRNRVVLEG